jgi:hypothetical protein
LLIIGLVVVFIVPMDGITNPILTATCFMCATERDCLAGAPRPGQRRSRMEDAMKAAIVRINELIVAALIFGAVIGLVAHLSSLDAQSVGAPETPNVAHYLSHIPHYLSRSLFPSNGYRAI